MSKELLELGERFYDIDPYEARDCEETPETLAELIKNDPVTVINCLLDIIEDLQA